MTGEGFSLHRCRRVNKCALLRHPVSPRGDVARVLGFQRNGWGLVVLLLPVLSSVGLGISRAVEPAFSAILACACVSKQDYRIGTRDYLQVGLVSSHFFFLLRHVIQPVLVRLLKLRFRFLGSCCSMGSGFCDE